MKDVKMPAPANQRIAAGVIGSKPRAAPTTPQPAAAMPAVSSSERNAPLSSSPEEAPRTIVTFATAKHSDEAVLEIAPREERERQEVDGGPALLQQCLGRIERKRPHDERAVRGAAEPPQ